MAIEKNQRVILVEKIIDRFHRKNLADFLKTVAEEPKIKGWSEADILQHWIEFQNADEAVL